MSGISYSNDVNLQLHNSNPNFTDVQEVELLPFPQNFPSPLFYDEQIFNTMALAADQTQQADYRAIWNEPLPKVNITNMNTEKYISANTSSAAHLLSDPSCDHSSGMKKSTLKKGSSARKSGKKDRHSKINTAQGVRHRRIRLSVPTASQFFHLQDTLGSDKASNTISWLLSKAKKAITKLYGSPSHVSEMNNNNICQNGLRGGENSAQKRKVNSEGERVIGLKTVEKSVTSGNTKYYIAKEARDKARARARERTMKKLMNKCLEESNYNFHGEASNSAQLLGLAEYPNLLSETGHESMSNLSSRDNNWTSQSSLHRELGIMALLGVTASSSGYNEKTGDIFTGELHSLFNNQVCYTRNWVTNYEYSNPNSFDFQGNLGNHF